MRPWLRILLIAVAIAVALPFVLFETRVLGVASDVRREAWHQRMTLTVETPEGLVTASSVQAIGWSGWEDDTRETLGTQQGRSTS